MPPKDLKSLSWVSRACHTDARDPNAVKSSIENFFIEEIRFSAKEAILYTTKILKPLGKEKLLAKWDETKSYNMKEALTDMAVDAPAEVKVCFPSYLIEYIQNFNNLALNFPADTSAINQEELLALNSQGLPIFSIAVDLKAWDLAKFLANNDNIITAENLTLKQITTLKETLASDNARKCYKAGVKVSDIADFDLVKIKALTSKNTLQCYKAGMTFDDLNSTGVLDKLIELAFLSEDQLSQLGPILGIIRSMIDLTHLEEDPAHQSLNIAGDVLPEGGG